MIRPERVNNLKRPPTPPAEYAGQWVAWNQEQTQIVAHGAQIDEVLDAAIAAGHPAAVLQKVRTPRVAYIGTT